MQHQLSTLAGEDQTFTKSSGAVDLVGEEDGLHGGGQVGDDTSHTEIEGLLGDTSQAEGILDNFLYIGDAQLAYAGPATQTNGDTYRLGLHTRHNINIILIVLSYRQLAIECLCANHKPCALSYLSRRRRVAHKSGGNRLVSGEREARRDGGTEQIAGRRGHLGLADLVAQTGASHGGIGARECAERRAGGGVAVHGGEEIYSFCVVVGLASRRKEKPRVRPDSSVNSPNWPFKKLGQK